MAVTEQEVLEALKKVVDPELGINIVDLGLVYNVVIEGGRVEITMTLTSPACPVGPEISRHVQEILAGLDGVGESEVELTFSPPWSEDMMSPLAKMYLR